MSFALANRRYRPTVGKGMFLHDGGVNRIGDKVITIRKELSRFPQLTPILCGDGSLKLRTVNLILESCALFLSLQNGGLVNKV